MREAGLKLLLLDCPEKVDPAWTIRREIRDGGEGKERGLRKGVERG